jgi:ribose transport system permease protein
MTTKYSESTAVSTTTEDDQKGFLARASKLQSMQIIGFLIGLVIIFGAMRPATFLTVFNIRSIVVNTSIFAILGVGMTFVIITAGIDLSIGAVLVFSGVLADKVMAAMGSKGWGVAFAGIATAMIAGTLWGFVNGWLVAKAKVPAFIVTLGTLGAALGLALIMTEGVDLRDAPDVLVNSIGFGNIYWQIPALSVVSVIVVVTGIILLHRTRFGLHTFAVGSNLEGCRRVGINVDRQLILVYMVAGLCAGIAGILNLVFFQSTTLVGQSNTALVVIAGVVIGGTSLFGGIGSIFGTIIGLLIPVVLQDGFIIINVQPFWQQVVVGVFLVAAVYVDGLRRAAAQGGVRRHNKRSQIGNRFRKENK